MDPGVRPWALKYTGHVLVGSSSWRLAEMSLEGCSATLQTVDCGLWGDGLEEGCDELAQQTPGGGPCQAAVSQRGESSNASTSGSSNRIIKR